MDERLENLLEIRNGGIDRYEFQRGEVELMIKLGLFAIIFCEGGIASSNDVARKCRKEGVPAAYFKGGLSLLQYLFDNERKEYYVVRSQIELIPHRVILQSKEIAHRSHRDLTVNNDAVVGWDFDPNYSHATNTLGDLYRANHRA
jgi:hypothetical protein